MEGFGTYTAIQAIAARAFKEYQEKLFRTADPCEYATNTLRLYRSASALNPIRDNVYHRYLVEAHPGAVRNEIVRQIENSQTSCNEK